MYVEACGSYLIEAVEDDFSLVLEPQIYSIVPADILSLWTQDCKILDSPMAVGVVEFMIPNAELPRIRSLFTNKWQQMSYSGKRVTLLPD
jgi:hypothetical protein